MYLLIKIITFYVWEVQIWEVWRGDEDGVGRQVLGAIDGLPQGHSIALVHPKQVDATE